MASQETEPSFNGFMNYLVNERVPGMDTVSLRRLIQQVDHDLNTYGGIIVGHKPTGEFRSVFGVEREVTEPVILRLTPDEQATLRDYLSGMYTQKLAADMQMAREEQYMGGMTENVMEEMRSLEEADLAREEIEAFAARMGAIARGEAPPGPAARRQARRRSEQTYGPPVEEYEYTRPPPSPQEQPRPTPTMAIPLPPAQEVHRQRPVTEAPPPPVPPYMFLFPLGLMGRPEEERAQLIRNSEVLEVQSARARAVSNAAMGRFRRAAQTLAEQFRGMGTFAFTLLTEDGQTYLQLWIPKGLSAETRAKIEEAVAPILHPATRPKAAAPTISSTEQYLREKLYNEYVGANSVYNRVAGPVRAMVKPFAKTMAECADSKGISITRIDDMWDNFDWHTSPAERGASASSLAASLKDNISAGMQMFMERIGCMTPDEIRARIEENAIAGLDEIKKEIERLQESVYTAKSTDFDKTVKEASELQDELKEFMAEPKVPPQEAAEAMEKEAESAPSTPPIKASEDYSKLKTIFRRTGNTVMSAEEIRFAGSMRLRLGSPDAIDALIREGIKEGYLVKTKEGSYELM